MALIDHIAAARLVELREAAGFSPEALSLEIERVAATAPWGARGAVDAHTIRRVERHGHVPSERVRFVLAQFFGLVPHEIWPSSSRRVTA